MRASLSGHRAKFPPGRAAMTTMVAMLVGINAYSTACASPWRSAKAVAAARLLQPVLLKMLVR